MVPSVPPPFPVDDNPEEFFTGLNAAPSFASEVEHDDEDRAIV